MVWCGEVGFWKVDMLGAKVTVQTVRWQMLCNICMYRGLHSVVVGYLDVLDRVE